jgi:VCBS repeat-containing protein
VTASSGTTLDLTGSIANGGEIDAAASGGTIDLEGASITGGTLGGTGTIATVGANSESTLSGVTIASGTKVTASANTTLDLTGSIANGGEIDAAASGGTIDLENASITGGTLGGAGTIDVVSSSKIQGTPTVNAILNTGKVTVESGQTLQLDNVTVTGTTFTDPGTIKVDSGNTLTLAGTDTITGGQFAIGQGKVATANGGGVLLSGVSIGNLQATDPQVTLTISATNASNLAIAGGINEPDGTVQITGTLAEINAALAIGLTYDPSVTPTVLTMTIVDSLGDTAFRSVTINTPPAGSPTLQVTDASGAIRNGNVIDIVSGATVTLSSDEVFNGSGNLKVEANALLKLIHTGTHGGTITDNGTIEITGESGLNGGSLNIGVNGFLTVDSAKLLTLNKMTVTGGTVTDGGTIEIIGSSAINGAHLNNGGVTVDSGQTLTLDGTTVAGTTITGTDATSIVHVDDGQTLTLNGATISGGTINDGTATGTIVSGVTVFGDIDVTGISTIKNASLNYGDIKIEQGITLTLDNAAVTGTSIEVDGAVGSITPGNLILQNGTTVSGSQLTIDAGDQLTMNGATISGGTTTDKGLIDVIASSTINGNLGLIGGQIKVEDNSTLTLGNALSIGANTVTLVGANAILDDSAGLSLAGGTIGGLGNLAADTNLSGYGTVSIPLNSANTITASGGTLEFTSAIDSSAATTFHIANVTNSVLKFDGTVGTSGKPPTIVFDGGDGGKGALDLTSLSGGLANFHATVSGFDEGEGIKISGAVSASLNGTSSTLTVYDTLDHSHALGTITLATSYAGDTFAVSGDGTITVDDLVATPSSTTATEGTAVGVTVTDDGAAVSSGLTYQWQVNHGSGYVNVAANGNSSSYTPTEADEGGALQVSVTYADVAGNETTTSNSTNTVLDAAPTVTTPTISGTAQEGMTLTASASAGQSDNAVSYQWQTSTDGGATYHDIVGATGSTYLVKEGDEGNKIEVVATTTNDNGATISATSTTATAAVVDNSSLSVSIDKAAPKEGDLLTATPVIGDGDDGSAPISYQWQEKIAGVWTNISGANAATYTVTEANENHPIQVLASFTDDTGVLVSATSTAATAAVVDNSSLSVSIDKTAPKEGDLLTATPVIGDGDDGSAPVSYQWQEKIAGVWTDISGANAATYTVTEANENHPIQVLASFTDDTGVLVSATSTAATAAVVDNSSLSVSIDNTAPKDGDLLTATPVIGDGDDASATVSYQWQEKIAGVWTDISGAKAATYTVTEANENHPIQVLASFTDDTGVLVSATSAATATVTDDAPVIGATSIVTGSVTEAGALALIAEAGAGGPLHVAAALSGNGTVVSALGALDGHLAGLPTASDVDAAVTAIAGVSDPATAIAVVWQHLDSIYASGPNQTNINAAFTELGLEYAAYLKAGGSPLVDVVAKYIGAGGDADALPDRVQSLHDNLLGNLTDSALHQRYDAAGLYTQMHDMVSAQDATLLTRTAVGGYETDAPGSAAAAHAYDLQHGYAAHVSGQLTATDVDTNDAGHLTWTVAGTSAYGTMSIDASTGQWTYTLDDSLAATKALGAGDTVTQSFVATVTDADGGSANQTVTMTIHGTNDAPVATAPSAHYSATTQTDLNLHNTGLSVSDVDGGSGVETVTLTAGQGIVTIGAGDSGVTNINGNGSGSVTFAGTISQINALLNTGTGTVVYNDNAASPAASTTLTLTVHDNGNTGGGDLSASASSTIDVTAPVAGTDVMHLVSQSFLGGAGDQAATSVAYLGGHLYLTYEAPVTQSISDNATIVGFNTGVSAPTQSFSENWGYGFFGGVATDGSEIYAAGGSNPGTTLTHDGVGGAEDKSILVRFNANGTAGSNPAPAIGNTPNNFYSYAGVELFQNVLATNQAGNTIVYAVGFGQPNGVSNGYVIAEYNSSGALLNHATDSVSGASDMVGAVEFNGAVWAVGETTGTPTVWTAKYDLSSIVAHTDSVGSGSFNGAAVVGNALYAVGGVTSNGGDYLVAKYNTDGSVAWSQSFGGSGADTLTGAVALNGHLYVVGSTANGGNTDGVLMEISTTNGSVISTTTFGGALYDSFNSITTDGHYLYIAGESKSFTNGGNGVGQDDAILLTYSPAPAITGSLSVVAVKGGGVQLTSATATANLQAVDPGYTPDQLTFTVTGTSHGYLASSATGPAITSFTQAQLDSGSVFFVAESPTYVGQGSFTVALSDGVAGRPAATTTVGVTMVDAQLSVLTTSDFDFNQDNPVAAMGSGTVSGVTSTSFTVTNVAANRDFTFSGTGFVYDSAHGIFTAGTITSILETDDVSHTGLVGFTLNVPVVDWMNAAIAKANGDHSLIEAMTKAWTFNFVGNNGSDAFDSGDQNDIFTGKAGNDTLSGKFGYDRANYGNATAGINVQLANGVVTGDGSVGTDTLQSIEMVTGSNFADTFNAVGFSSASTNAGSTVTANTGGLFNEFEGRGGDDTIIGNGQTRVSYLHATAGITATFTPNSWTSAASGGSGIVVGDASTGTDTFTGVNSVRGTNFADIFHGSNNSAGSAENFEGLGGNDLIDGGGGFDRAVYNFAHDGVGITVNLAAGTVTGGPDTGTDTLVSVEGIWGTEFADIYNAVGFSTSSTNPGSSGVDGNGIAFNEFEGGGGNDTITGNGNTRIAYYHATGGVVVTLGIGSVHGSAVGASTGIDDIVTGVSAVAGSEFNDILTGNGTFNTLDGRGGNDVLDGGGANDTLIGGTGSDIFVYKPGYGVTTIADFSHASGDRIDLRAFTGIHGIGDLTFSVSGSTLTINSATYFPGSIHNIVVQGYDPVSNPVTASDFIFNVAGGSSVAVTVQTPDGYDFSTLYDDMAASSLAPSADTVNHIFAVDAAKGITFELIGTGFTYDANSHLPLTGAITEIDILNTTDPTQTTQDHVLVNTNGWNIAAASLFNAIADYHTDQTHTTGLDTIFNAATYNIVGSNGVSAPDNQSGGGADVLFGGDHPDVFNGSPGPFSSGDDTVDYSHATTGLTADLLHPANNTNAAAGDTYISIENLRGTAFDDILTGDGNNNVLEGGLGNNILNGSGGNDTASYAHATAGVTVSLAIATPQNTIGAGTDTLNNISNLTGSHFNDTLTGDSHDNVLSGNGGNDILFGGGGNDTFVFNPAMGHGTINDFTSGQDHIQLNLAVPFSSGNEASFQSWATTSSHVVQVGADTLITFDAADTILLKNVNTANLHASDFILPSHG